MKWLLFLMILITSVLTNNGAVQAAGNRIDQNVAFPPGWDPRGLNEQVLNRLPRGIRNNNPGNIVKTKTVWQGEIECKDTKFECFESPFWGIRAMVRVLVNYRIIHGLYYIEDIINRWTATDKEAFTKYVLPCQHSETFRTHMACTVTKIIEFENGVNPYHPLGS